MNSVLKEVINIMVNEELKPGEVVVYVDMDGVLVDFMSGISQDPAANAARDRFLSVMQNFPELKGLSDDELKAVLAGEQRSPGLKALKKAWNEWRNLKFMISGKEGFFANLQPLPGAREMLQTIATMVGRKPSILTAPVSQNSDRCEQEKILSVEKNFSGLYSSFYCTQDKYKFAGPNRILIDDRVKYTVPFANNGGISILHTSPKQTIIELQAILAGNKV